MNQKENLIGGAVLLLIALVIGFLVLRPKGDGGDSGIKDAGQAQLAQVNSILKPSLLPLLKVGSQGALTVSQGQGSLPGGDKWRYKNSWPNPDLKVRNAEGRLVKLSSSGKGQGGTLWMQAQGSLNAPLATQLARKALNDPKLEILSVGGKNYLESKRIVASGVSIKGERLRVDGLFSSKLCAKKGLSEPAVENSCRKKIRSRK